MATNLYSRIMENGTAAGWYWELITKTHEVLARGLADTHAAARTEAAQAARKAKQEQNSSASCFREASKASIID